MLNFNEIVRFMKVHFWGVSDEQIKFLREWLAGMDCEHFLVRDPNEVMHQIVSDIKEDKQMGYQWTKDEREEAAAIINLYITLQCMGYIKLNTIIKIIGLDK